MLVMDTRTYLEQGFRDEAEIERVVAQHAQVLFGNDVIFLPKTKIETQGGTSTIPDGFAIDILKRRWFIVEAELAEHGTWDHIAPQINKQLAAAQSADTRAKLRAAIMGEVKKDRGIAARLEEAGINKLDVATVVQSILDKPPIVAVPIDEEPKDWEAWVKTLRNVVQTWVIRKFQCSTDDSIAYLLPEEAAPTMETSIKDGAVTVSRPTAIMSALLQAGLLNEGQVLVFKYGPKGQQRTTFEGTAHANGILIGGQTMTPSAAAAHCMKKAGGKGEAANGRDLWKTSDGQSLNDLLERIRL